MCAGESAMDCEANASRKHGDSDDGSDASTRRCHVGGHCASVLQICAASSARRVRQLDVYSADCWLACAGECCGCYVWVAAVES